MSLAAHLIKSLRTRGHTHLQEVLSVLGGVQILVCHRSMERRLLLFFRMLQLEGLAATFGAVDVILSHSLRKVRLPRHAVVFVIDLLTLALIAK